MRHLFIVSLLLIAPYPFAEWAESVPVGADFPQIDAVDQHGKRWANADLMGEHGLVFFFNRSTSW